MRQTPCSAPCAPPRVAACRTPVFSLPWTGTLVSPAPSPGRPIPFHSTTAILYYSLLIFVTVYHPVHAPVLSTPLSPHTLPFLAAHLFLPEDLKKLPPLTVFPFPVTHRQESLNQPFLSRSGKVMNFNSMLTHSGGLMCLHLRGRERAEGGRLRSCQLESKMPVCQYMLSSGGAAPPEEKALCLARNPLRPQPLPLRLGVACGRRVSLPGGPSLKDSFSHPQQR